MVTQQDIQRAMASPLASSPCTPDDIAAVLPGFTAVQSGVGLPRWSDKTFALGWSIGIDPVPYFTRVCYKWTAHAAGRKEQSIFIGVGSLLFPDRGPYSMRSDTCLSAHGTVQPRYEWSWATSRWDFRACLGPPPPVGLQRPNWLESAGATIMGRIRGNPAFGLAADQTLNLIAAETPGIHGELAIFWLWFLENGVGTLFSEGNYMNPISHNLQLIDYNLFLRDAPLDENDFCNPCGWGTQAPTTAASAHGHFTRAHGRVRG
jgi:hypothetical protein